MGCASSAPVAGGSAGDTPSAANVPSAVAQSTPPAGFYDAYKAAFDAKDAAAVAALYADDCEWMWHSSGKTMSKEAFVNMLPNFLKMRPAEKQRLIYETSDICVSHSFVKFPSGDTEAVMMVQMLTDGKATKVETGSTSVPKGSPNFIADDAEPPVPPTEAAPANMPSVANAAPTSFYDAYKAAFDAKDAAAVAALYADDCEWMWHSSGKTMSKEAFVDMLPNFLKFRPAEKQRLIYETSDICVSHSFVKFPSGDTEAVMMVQMLTDGKATKVETGSTSVPKGSPNFVADEEAPAPAPPPASWSDAPKK